MLKGLPVEERDLHWHRKHMKHLKRKRKKHPELFFNPPPMEAPEATIETAEEQFKAAQLREVAKPIPFWRKVRMVFLKFISFFKYDKP